MALIRRASGPHHARRAAADLLAAIEFADAITVDW
jgi:hypothetical protein